MMFQPSARDKRLASLRSQAISRGARVSLGSGQAQGFTRYSMPWQAKRRDRNFWRLMRKNYSHPVHLAEFWSVESTSEPDPSEREWLTQQLHALPASIGFVEAAPDGVALFWSEPAGKEELAFILQWLEVAAGR
ncbi:hypothetical protein [Simiduia agarivorans]|uniref:Uncharacterized protein n=1 Tax=Simiduia agarivorans (strain DSM 21679 / JCM 13881 / BCRC 17597 / SA1) TaxID=1117647 RepID=K4KET6_SIMAS|nr:hypothetical protein [Simiduia agarivorans]AFU97456.1 hypothetical protein M5M_01125 [Simiduia agarivorans SA1 = DSM 21679]